MLRGVFWDGKLILRQKNDKHWFWDERNDKNWFWDERNDKKWLWDKKMIKIDCELNMIFQVILSQTSVGKGFWGKKLILRRKNDKNWFWDKKMIKIDYE